MGSYQDQDYLLSEQYQDDANLGARINLHRRFSTNPESWFDWVFDIFDLPATSRVLEVGCGPGDLWLENIDRIPPGWEITLSDFSTGMVRRAKQRLRAQSHPFTWAIIDAQEIPFPGQHFDAVIANHMLYHLPDRQKALREFRRVLKQEGKLYAATVGEGHMQELKALVARFDPTLANKHDQNKNEFTLESGRAQLAELFGGLKIHREENDLQVDQPEPLVAYILSSFRLGVGHERRAALTRFVQGEMTRQGGSIWIGKDNGLFEASAPKG
jgi:SAM-dependent methyltransferase